MLALPKIRNFLTEGEDFKNRSFKGKEGALTLQKGDQRAHVESSLSQQHGKRG